MTTRTFDVELRPIEAIKPYPGNHVFAHTHMHDLFRKWLEAAT